MASKFLMKSFLILPFIFVSSCGSSPVEPSSYSITYNLNGGEMFHKTNPTSYQSDSETFTLNIPYKTGYIFKGWSSQPTGTPNLKTVIEKGTKGDLTFYAQYKIDSYAFKGKAVNDLPDGMKSYLNSATEDTANYLYNFAQDTAVSERTNPHGVLVHWSNINNAESVTLSLSDDQDFTHLIFNQEFITPSYYTFYNLFPQTTYYVRVVDSNDDLLFNDSFTLATNVRTINIDGVVNMRDIGGWETEDNTSIPYGKVYRSSNLQNITEKGLETLKELNIKTELDLLYYTDTQPISIDENINYVNAPMWQWQHAFPGASSEIPSDTFTINGLTKALKVFTDKNNYPIDVHCSGGADRTGTVMFVLEGLLGYTYESMARDFELTTFSTKGNRYRTGISYDETKGKYYYDDNNIMKDGSGFNVVFNSVYNHVKTTYQTESGLFKDAMENYVKTVLKLTDEEISLIRYNILN